MAAQNEYQLKLRDLALNERVRQFTDKAAAEAAEAAARCAPRSAAQRCTCIIRRSRLLPAPSCSRLHYLEAPFCHGSFDAFCPSPRTLQRYDALLADSADQGRQFEARLAAAEEAGAAQLLALDTQFQAKLVAEMERLRDLGAAKDDLNAR